MNTGTNQRLLDISFIAWIVVVLSWIAVSISWASEIVENRNRIKALEHQLIINQP